MGAVAKKLAGAGTIDLLYRDVEKPASESPKGATKRNSQSLFTALAGNRKQRHPPEHFRPSHFAHRPADSATVYDWYGSKSANPADAAELKFALTHHDRTQGGNLGMCRSRFPRPEYRSPKNDLFEPPDSSDGGGSSRDFQWQDKRSTSRLHRHRGLFIPGFTGCLVLIDESWRKIQNGTWRRNLKGHLIFWSNAGISLRSSILTGTN